MASKKKAPPPRGEGGPNDEWHYERFYDQNDKATFLVRDKAGSIVATVDHDHDARMISRTPSLFKMLLILVCDFPEFETGGEISGAELVEYIGDIHAVAKKIVQEAGNLQLEIDEEEGIYVRKKPGA